MGESVSELTATAPPPLSELILLSPELLDPYYVAFCRGRQISSRMSNNRERHECAHTQVAFTYLLLLVQTQAQLQANTIK